MTTGEILWMVHQDTVQHFKDNEPGKVRKYLIDMGDEETLISWDKEQMKKPKAAGR